MKGVCSMVTENEAMSHEFSTLRRDLEAIKSDLKKLKNSGGSFAKSAFEAGKSSIFEAKGQLGESLKAASIKGRAGLQDLRDDVEGRIEERPLAAVGTALLAGLVVGLLVASGKRVEE